MPHYVRMPQLGVSEESGLIAVWHVKPGDAVKPGDLLFSLETGKTSFDVEADAGGTVLALLRAEGDEVAIQTPVCVIGQPGEAFDQPEAVPAAAAAAPATPAPDTARAPVPVPIADLGPPTAARSSPRARALGEKAGVDVGRASPTGPEGRIIERDVRALIARGPAEASAVPSTAPGGSAGQGAYEDKPLTTIRKLIAKNMRASLTDMAQLTHNASFDASALFAFRALCKENPETAKITLTDMILFAVSRTLPAFPTLNAWLLGDKIRQFSGVNLACAVDTERGLMVPVVFGADKLSLGRLSDRVKTLAAECQSGKI
ncbi:MAG: 2-oxo acid dehydrogenase subunit E2, partial [Oscillospiraceae bacterium]|nr:2-oxo acid dehydrogenase subunit E2 [Oscillospiraceae bacterium]